MSRAERAKALFEQGYACSQAVALAFCDVLDVDKDALAKMTLPFGGGLGRLRLTCGAVSGMALVVGALCAKAENSPENKKNTYAVTRMLCEKFQAENGSLICGELLTGANVQATVGGDAEPRTEQYYKKRPCGDIVYSAAHILEEYLKGNGII